MFLTYSRVNCHQFCSRSSRTKNNITTDSMLIRTAEDNTERANNEYSGMNLSSFYALTNAKRCQTIRCFPNI